MAALIHTARGLARVTAHVPTGRRRAGALVVVLHGAGTDTSRSPLPELCDQLALGGIAAVRFDQPYRVAGRRAPDPAHLLDRALLDAMPALRRYARRGAPLALVGRSSGARVACRLAAQVGARAVACLGFPLQPPGRSGATPKPDRSGELRGAAADAPVLVVQGARDPFGRPGESERVHVVIEPGAAHVPTVRMARIAGEWLIDQLLGDASRAGSVESLPPTDLPGRAAGEHQAKSSRSR